MIFSIFEGDTLIDFEQILFVKKNHFRKIEGSPASGGPLLAIWVGGGIQ